jgi:hypothetical protein
MLWRRHGRRQLANLDRSRANGRGRESNHSDSHQVVVGCCDKPPPHSSPMEGLCLHTLVNNVSFLFFATSAAPHTSAPKVAWTLQKDCPPTNFERGSPPNGKSRVSKARIRKIRAETNSQQSIVPEDQCPQIFFVLKPGSPKPYILAVSLD